VFSSSEGTRQCHLQQYIFNSIFHCTRLVASRGTYYLAEAHHKAFDGESSFRLILVRGDLCAAVVLVEAVAAAPRLLSSMLRMTALDCGSPCHRRSGSGRWLFNVLSASWSVHGAVFCSESNVWSCYPVLAGGFRTGFFVRCFFGVAIGGGGLRCSVRSLGVFALYFLHLPVPFEKSERPIYFIPKMK
jgi:hypothetical protein